MMISSYKSPIDDSIFADLSLYADDLTTSDHEKSDSEKEWDALYPSDRYIEDSESSTYSQEYVDDSQEFVEETTESSTDNSSLESDEEDYPPIFMNHHKEPDVSEVDDDLDDMIDDLIPERRPEPTNTIPKNIGTGFHTFTLDDVKVTAWPQRIQDFYTLMVTKNLFEREKYMILSKFTSRFSDILRDWWTAIGVADRNFFLTSQDFTTNLNILLEVLCGDTGQRREKLRRQLFEMKCISFDRDIIDVYFQKMARIYFELDGDSSLKQAFVLSLPKILAGHAMTIIEDRFKSITIPHIDYVRQAIFQALDSICTKRFVLKHVVQNNPALDKACSRSDLVTKSDCSCSSHRARRKIVNRDDDLESIFSLEDEPTGETLFSIDVYEMASDDTNIDDDPSHNMYQISNTKIVDFPREVDTSHVQLAIYSSKWDKDVHVIALMDTGVASFILNPAILPDE
ncbi:hypothetical protein KY290_000998 [Solanum tuberosum]|uniref:Uncharacterized protein n=1 Tax=Solanum tuberosum TaxID=4113 RepID=A0ABQ7WLJ4_SOLTU|nr:hypothetical protein KY290_000998 [Solanum tuberosum]